jgi:hypothetical protein
MKKIHGLAGHIHRGRERSWTARERLKQSQRQYEVMRSEPIKISLATAPWEKKENDDGPDNGRL